jgi:hypothetical protein
LLLGKLGGMKQGRRQLVRFKSFLEARLKPYQDVAPLEDSGTRAPAFSIKYRVPTLPGPEANPKFSVILSSTEKKQASTGVRVTWRKAVDGTNTSASHAVTRLNFRIKESPSPEETSRLLQAMPPFERREAEAADKTIDTLMTLMETMPSVTSGPIGSCAEWLEKAAFARKEEFWSDTWFLPDTFLMKQDRADPVVVKQQDERLSDGFGKLMLRLVMLPSSYDIHECMCADTNR